RCHVPCKPCPKSLECESRKPAPAASPSPSRGDEPDTRRPSPSPHPHADLTPAIATEGRFERSENLIAQRGRTNAAPARCAADGRDPQGPNDRAPHDKRRREAP